jgi:hypothetical protein
MRTPLGAITISAASAAHAATWERDPARQGNGDPEGQRDERTEEPALSCRFVFGRTPSAHGSRSRPSGAGSLEPPSVG